MIIAGSLHLHFLHLRLPKIWKKYITACIRGVIRLSLLNPDEAGVFRGFLEGGHYDRGGSSRRRGGRGGGDQFVRKYLAALRVCVGCVCVVCVCGGGVMSTIFCFCSTGGGGGGTILFILNLPPPPEKKKGILWLPSFIFTSFLSGVEPVPPSPHPGSATALRSP